MSEPVFINAALIKQRFKKQLQPCSLCHPAGIAQTPFLPLHSNSGAICWWSFSPLIHLSGGGKINLQSFTPSLSWLIKIKSSNESMSGRQALGVFCVCFSAVNSWWGENPHTPGKRAELGRLEAKPWCEIKKFLLPTEVVISVTLDIPFQPSLDSFSCPDSQVPLRSVRLLSTGQVHSLAAPNKGDKWGIHQHSLEFHPCPTAEFRSGEGSLDKCWGRLKFPGFDIAVLGWLVPDLHI